jgi:hypothetical protein
MSFGFQVRENPGNEFGNLLVLTGSKDDVIAAVLNYIYL